MRCDVFLGIDAKYRHTTGEEYLIESGLEAAIETELEDLYSLFWRTDTIFVILLSNL